MGVRRGTDKAFRFLGVGRLEDLGAVWHGEWTRTKDDGYDDG